MFIGIVVIIMILCISILAMVNSYFLSFSKNYIDLSDYYQSQYAAISAMDTCDQLSNEPITGDINNRIWTGECGGNIFTGKMGEFTNSINNE